MQIHLLNPTKWMTPALIPFLPENRMQIATDADSEIITAMEVTPANFDDRTQFEGLMDGHQRTVGRPEAAAADSGYNRGENRKRLFEDGIEDFIMPPTAKGHRQGIYSATDFDVHEAVPLGGAS